MFTNAGDKMETKAEFKKEIKAYINAIINYPYNPKERKTDVLRLMELVLDNKNREFLELIEKINYDKNNIAIIEFKKLLVKAVEGKK